MNKLKFSAIAIIGLVVMASIIPDDDGGGYFTIRNSNAIKSTDPPCLQLYYYIDKYSDTFDIPKRFAFGIANAETGYRGPLHFSYKHSQTSCAGAVGPMQVMTATARWINKDNISTEYLKNNIRYNVYTSMKYLRKLHNKNKNWKVSFGEYNTGYPCVNDYAKKVFNYKINWK